MARTIFPEYRDQYECSKYPFEDTATLMDSERTITIPTNIFLDAGFCFTDDFPYLSEISISSSDLRFTVTAGYETATCEMPLDALEDVLYFKDTRGHTVGCLVSEKARLSWFVTQEPGTYKFYNTATSFVVRCNIPTAQSGLLSISAQDMTFTGDVILVGGPGIALTYDGSSNSIQINVLGEVLYKRAQCTGSFTTPNCLRTVNGIESDKYGNILIGLQDPDDISQIRMNTSMDGIEIKKISSSYEYVEDEE